MVTNQVTLIGRLTKDVQIRKGGKGDNAWKLAQFTLAVRDGVDKDNNVLAQFISCKAWGNIATVLESYTGKGSQIAVSGKIVQNDWEDEDGQKHYGYEVLVTELQLLDPKKKDSDEEEEEDKPHKKSFRK